MAHKRDRHLFEWNEAKPSSWKSFRDGLSEDRRRHEERANGWGGLVSLVLLTAFVIGFGWVEFYGNGLEAYSFLRRNWPPDPELGKYYRWFGWAMLGLGLWTAIGTIWVAGREGMSFARFFKSVWVALVIGLVGFLMFALAHKYDRWFTIHGAMTQEEIRAAPRWAEPGLPPWEEMVEDIRDIPWPGDSEDDAR